jgi:hypothetical protein
MNNKPEHIPFCQTSSAIAASCPGCRWVLLQQSQPLPEMIFKKKLTHEDKKFLAELLIAF